MGAISDSGISGISTSGVLAFNGGALQYTGAGAASTLRGVTNIGIAYIDVTNNAAQLTLGGVISGGNGLTKFGAGTLVLAGTNTYSGGTTINNGTVAISADFNLGAAGEALILGGGTLEATTNLALDSTRPITLNSPGGTFNVDTNSTLTVGNTINNGTGSGALTKTGVGTLVLSNAANNYSGGTVINAGILALGSDGATNENAGALGSGLVTITGNSQLRLGGGANLSYSIGNGIALSNGVIYAAAGVQNLTGSLTVNPSCQSDCAVSLCFGFFSWSFDSWYHALPKHSRGILRKEPSDPGPKTLPPVTGRLSQPTHRPADGVSIGTLALGMKH